MKKRLLNILFWAVISAAFIGPGTITTASNAGASFGFSLLWALVFSTLACLVFQEAVARLTIHSNLNLGEAIRSRFKGKSSRFLILLLVLGSIILGSAAYETGNLLGAVAGIRFLLPWNPALLVGVIGLLALGTLLTSSLKKVATFLGFIVVVMGISFFTTAILLKPSFMELVTGSFVPRLPASGNAGLLVLGLVGTTVVPYNLFLGSGMATRDQSIKEMRFGLSVAIILGGLISMSVLVTGAYVEGAFSVATLVDTLHSVLGKWAVVLFSVGMFSAGFSSAITAPLASAITAKSLYSMDTPGKWSFRSLNFRLTWGGVLLTGIVLGMVGFQPIPAIILAQALNGLILPFIAIFIVLVINDPRIMGRQRTNSLPANMLLLLVVWASLVLGILNLFKAVLRTFPSFHYLAVHTLPLVYIFATLIWLWVLGSLVKLRNSYSDIGTHR